MVNLATTREDAKQIALPVGPAVNFDWRAVLFCKEALLLLAVRIITDPVWQFILYWFPKYVTNAHGMTLAQVGHLVWIVYLAADVGGVGAGLLCGLLVCRGLVPAQACKWVMIGCALIIPTPRVHADAAFARRDHRTGGGDGAGGVCVHDLRGGAGGGSASARGFGTTWGLVCAGSGLGGIVFTSVVGHLVTSFSYTPVFILMACLHPLSLLLVWPASRRQNELIPVAVLAS